MRKLFYLYFLLSVTITFSQEMKIDFGVEKDGVQWKMVNDNLMGGTSQGNYRYSDDGVVLFGNVTLKNNEGFASYRSNFKVTDISSYQKVTIKYRSKEYKFGFTMEMDKRWFMPYYKYELHPTDWKWVTEEFLISDFERFTMGRRKDGKPTPEELKKILRFGFITDEAKEGIFKIEIDYVKFE